MKRIASSFTSITKVALECPFLLVGVIYLFWFVLVPIPIDEYFSNGIRLLGIYFVIAVLEKLIGSNKILSIILLILLFPVAACAGVGQLYLMGGTFGWSGGEIIYVPLILLFSSYDAYNLYKSPSGDNRTLRTLLFLVTLPILALNVAHSVTYFPHVEDKINVDNEKYYLIWAIEDNIEADTHLTLYKCQKSSLKCEKLYRTYEQMFVDKLLYDKEKNEVSIIDSDYELGMAFTYGENSRSYDGYAVELGDHTYQLSIDYEYGGCKTTDCDIEVYIYTMYECDLDYKSCDMLPVKYTMTSVWGMYLAVNESTNEINAYDLEDTLIFTYRERPVCYADGCEILDQ